jgi:UPF0755 protein
MKFFKRLIIVFALFVLLISTIGYFSILNSLKPVNPNDKSVKLFYVNAGNSLNLVLKKLESDNLIKSYRAARIYTLVRHPKKSVKPGYYQLSKSMSFLDIFRKLASGDIYQVWITIPEGFSIKKIAKRLETKNLSVNTYIKLASDFDSSLKDEFQFLEKVNSPNTLEGYLFPDTYDITGGKEEDVIHLQLKRFEGTIYESWQNRPAGWKMSLHQTLTLASIVELEAQKPFERELISGVFMNRLQQGIPLGSDPTVEYALGWHQNEKGLSLKNVQIKSSYNTYINKGLPPGPIANPGLACFKAVLNYKHTPYLYFVAKGDGSHIFTTNYQDHLHAQALIKKGLLH